MTCPECNGLALLGKVYCALCSKTNALNQVKNIFKKEEFMASSPTPFIGRHGYPNINVGILNTGEQDKNAWEHDAPLHWSEHNYSQSQIVHLRSTMMNSRWKGNIKQVQSTSKVPLKTPLENLPNKQTQKLVDLAQEVGIAKKPVDIEYKLEQKPQLKLSFNAFTIPMGPNANLKKAILTENPKINHFVEKATSDTDLNATEALNTLFNKQIDEHQLSKILSVGSLGLKSNRKLVPTRWSITAVDDTLAKNIYKEILDFPEINDFLAYQATYMGNYYLILFYPHNWGYELFETFESLPTMYTDFEDHNGRKSYATNTAGGYYSVRLAILEHLQKIKRKAKVLALRVVTDEYKQPLGVWITREATRKALKNKPLTFASQELMHKYAQAIFQKKFQKDANIFFQNSKLQKAMNQKNLKHFFN